ncbi:MAG: sulfur carrier protein ThiS [Hydrogenovibrio sp.]|nr:sulfur carrier protein ThiS [Hydrogenovibrio sp.]
MTQSETLIAVSINGEVRQFPASISIAQLLEALAYRQTRFAVALNETFVPRSQYDHQTVADGDRIDIVAPMQGG